MTAQCLAKLTAKGTSLDGLGGEPFETPQDIAACLAGCPHYSYVAVLAKYADDQGSQKQLQGLLTHYLMGRYLKSDKIAQARLHDLSRRSAEVIYLQYLDGYRCNHCEGKGKTYEDGTPLDGNYTSSGKRVITCRNCHGNGHGCFSDEFKRIWMDVDSLEPYQKHMRAVEDMVNDWEYRGLAYLWRRRNLGENNA